MSEYLAGGQMDSLLQKTKSSVEDRRNYAARLIAKEASFRSRDMGPDDFSSWLKELYKHLFPTDNTTRPLHEKHGSLGVLDAILDELDENTVSTQVYIITMTCIKTVLQKEREDSVLEAAAKTLGKLSRVKSSSNFMAELVEAELQRALEWLNENEKSRRHAGALALSVLAEDAPSIFYTKVPIFLEYMWTALHDNGREPKIRLAGCYALKQCLRVIAERSSNDPTHVQWYKSVYDAAVTGVNSNINETVHGSLLALGELLSNTGSFMLDKYPTTAQLILSRCESSNRVIRSVALTLIPYLAHFSPDIFCGKEGYLDKSMKFLMLALKERKNPDRPQAFLAAGEIAKAIKTPFQPYLDNVVDAIISALTKSKKQSALMPSEQEALICLRLLAQALGPQLVIHIKKLQKLMFLTGLTQNLVDALSAFVNEIPEISTNIQLDLLDLLSKVLSHKPFERPGSTTFTSRMEETNVPTTKELILIALKTLGTFKFEKWLVKKFIDCVTEYLNHDSEQIRKAAVATSCQLILPWKGEVLQLNSYSAKSTHIVLTRLLHLLITDTHPEIRKAVLDQIPPLFDQYLAQTDNIQCLMIAVSDEEFEIRELAVKLLGRLVKRNPAVIVPFFRKKLIELLGELKLVTDSVEQEHCVRLLGHVLGETRVMVEPYVGEVLEGLLRTVKHGDSRVATFALRALGKLAKVGWKILQKHVDRLVSKILEPIQDQSSSAKRLEALRTLGIVIKWTGYVVVPLTTHPHLLPLLLNIMKTEQITEIRAEAAKVIGILGAIDPYRHRQTQLRVKTERKKKSDNGTADKASQKDYELDNDTQNYASRSLSESTGDFRASLTLAPSSEDFYPTMVINALIRILKDPTLSLHHNQAINSFGYMFQVLHLKMVPFLPIIIPTFLALIRVENQAQEFINVLFHKLAEITRIIKVYIKDYIEDILQTIKDVWQLSLCINILDLVEALSFALADDFHRFADVVIPYALKPLQSDLTNLKEPNRILISIRRLGPSIGRYLHLLIPHIVKLFESKDSDHPNLRKEAILTIGSLARRIDIGDYAASIIHPLVRVMDKVATKDPQTSSTLTTNSKASLNPVTSALPPLDDTIVACMETLCNLAKCLDRKYVVWMPMITKVLNKHKIIYEKYYAIVKPLEDSVDVYSRHVQFDESMEDELNDIHMAVPSEILEVNETKLKIAFETSRRSRQEDWVEWMRGFSIALIRESPSPSLRSCFHVSDYYPIVKELFNAAFLSCWNALRPETSKALLSSLQGALLAPDIPLEILQTLLGLAEFMEHDDKPLPFEASTLGTLSLQCRAYAKALHYRELDFKKSRAQNKGVGTLLTEDLISINNALGKKEAADGILKWVQKYQDTELDEGWYERLGRWDDALRAYKVTRYRDQTNSVALLGMMHCYEELGDWESLEKLFNVVWKDQSIVMALEKNHATNITSPHTSSNAHYSQPFRHQIASYAAKAAWNQNRWDLMETYVNLLDKKTIDGAFLNAVMNIHKKQFDVAKISLKTTYYLLDTELTALIGESYQRAYNNFVIVQQLEEMEEIIELMELSGEDEEHVQRRNVILHMWRVRLEGCKRDIYIWQKLLRVRSLVISPLEDTWSWIKFSSLCRQAGQFTLAEKTLDQLMGEKFSTLLRSKQPDKSITFPVEYPEVTYAYLKQLWAEDQQALAFQHLKQFSQFNSYKNPKLYSTIFTQLGNWQFALKTKNGGQLDQSSISEIAASHYKATTISPSSHKAWHSWAMINFEAVEYYKNRNDVDPHSLKRLIKQHLQNSIKGFFRSLACSPGKNLQDTLRLLNLFFQYPLEVYQHFMEGVEDLNVDLWLQVIPQIIARIHSNVSEISKPLQHLLSRIGKAHPQALVYPLSVASTSISEERRIAAQTAMNNMRQFNETLVNQSELVAKELIRVAILWPEMWHEGLEDASRHYFGDHNVEAMIERILPLQEKLKHPETTQEYAFIQAFEKDLVKAWEYCQRYKRNGDVSNMNKAWDIYYQVFRKIDKQLPTLTRLDLQTVSPLLNRASDLDLAVPGTYKPGRPIVRIHTFNPVLKVISSKQRPRKLTLYGSDGLDWHFLLKGHEDLRQDERVMQLFGLVNNLLKKDARTRNLDLSIQRYGVIPLSPHSGLIGWVVDSDTLHHLIRDYRQSHHIVLNQEHKDMLEICNDYEKLPVIQKTEVFLEALTKSDGKDVEQILWLRSTNSEIWLMRRSNYTTSLATMSMVGYILGLGDRHPSNLMVDRHTGKIIHIDFGDCFEVAMQREKYPEKIPFRLTRMLINAMEVSGIDGTFRSICEKVMTVLREHSESLVAVLEAFVYDPLLNWRLLPTKEVANPTNGRRTSISQRPPIYNNSLDDEESFSYSISSSSSVNTFDRGANDEMVPQDVSNQRAVSVINRIKMKLSGRDFNGNDVLDVTKQVDNLIDQATSVQNLCQCYVGWCPFW